MAIEIGTCPAWEQIDEDNGHGGGTVACWLPQGHDGPHYDASDDLAWQKGKPVTDDPPECDPAGEAERVAEVFDQAATDYAREETQ